MKLFPSIFFAVTIIIVAILVEISAAIYFSVSSTSDISPADSFESKTYQQIAKIKASCLKNDITVEYKLEKVENFIGRATITLRNTEGKEQYFSVEDVMLHTYHPIEIKQCGVYLIREFNYDFKISKPLPDFRVELWRYELSGQGVKILTLARYNKDVKGEGEVFYSYDFRVDSSERYLVLEKGYLGSSDFVIVIKNLKTLEDVFVLPISEVEKKNPNISGDIMFNDWSKDGRYFWGDIFEGAYVNGFFRIDTQNWKADIFEAPPDVLGGDALNIENSWITIHPGNVWYGFAELTEEEKAKRRKQNTGTELYIHNLITGNRQFVDKIDEPLWYFKPKWISENELEYTLPNGEEKIYKIK